MISADPQTADPDRESEGRQESLDPHLQTEQNPFKLVVSESIQDEQEELIIE